MTRDQSRYGVIEYEVEPTPNQRARAEHLLRNGYVTVRVDRHGHWSGKRNWNTAWVPIDNDGAAADVPDQWQ